MISLSPRAFGPLSFVVFVACSSSGGGTADNPAAGGAVDSTGGSTTGGTGTGGLGAGAVGAGGSAAGGTGAGAAATGGAATGGLGTGGSQASGGAATGGGSTGGGAPTGGTSTGGAGAGGAVTGGAPSTGGAPEGIGGTDAGTGGGDPQGTGGGGTQLTAGACTIGAGTQAGEGEASGSDRTARYTGADVTRNGANYKVITNGWGQNWVSHDIAWLGTSVTIRDYQGSRQDDGAPAGYPAVFCGRYSDTSKECGLPRAFSDITALNTVASWNHPDGNGTYNVSYDIWLGNGSGGGGGMFGGGGLESYFMVWLHDPADEQPAGNETVEGVEVANVPGMWNIVSGEVNNLPIINYVRAEGDDTHQIAFNIMDFINDAKDRAFEIVGNDVLAVALGFEIWSGPVTNLKIEDFCVDVQ